ncbi:leucyl aminopeptidase [Acidimicrobiia bacterium EGI L10123]|uniref:leucyl aminopeptidase n=1 Tax=Salinilacustrithrix flava TaxID=2957203 RepID=UPI003D7C2B42|nr:leucyl aminopeptidase [Acidimicrobiia bacterium EGI L10123]
MTVVTTLTKEAPEGAVPATGVSTEALVDHPLQGFLDAQGFTAEVGQTQVVPDADGRPTILVGVGADADRTVDDLRRAAGAVARAARTHRVVRTDLLDHVGELSPVLAAQALAEGIGLGQYTYTVLKSDPKPSLLEEVHVVGKGGKRVQDALDLGSAIADAVGVARDLVNEPGGTLTPPAFAREAVSLGESYGFEVTVLEKPEIEAAGMGGLLGVNRGSEIDPRFLELRWVPEGKPRGAVALVGKGITFDSGGLSIKPSDGMLTMKGDMGGGAAVVGAFCALSALRPRVEVRGYVPLTDNMTGGDAMRLGDVLRISNGKTVEVHNTDAEGRLVLADALSRASEAAPDAIVDLATLTGACMVALGDDHAGVMGSHDAWVEQVMAAGEAAGERSWRLPLPDDWRSKLDSDIADMKNISGTRYGGASIAALFLKEFVGEGIPWAHLDIAGPSFSDRETALDIKGGTGYGVRTLLALLKGWSKPR